MPDSIHAARWINQITGLGWDLHVFPVYDANWHREFHDIAVYHSHPWLAQNLDSTVRCRSLWPFSRGSNRIFSLAQQKLPASWISRARWLSHVIRWIKPDLIHTLEFQLGGYLTLEARSFYKGNFPPWAVTNWGSDIYCFGPLAEHKSKIQQILANCDYYGCECNRDLELARVYGFRGVTMPVVPIAGGFPVERMQHLRRPGASSSRRLMLLKGYQGWAGRALFGLRSIELCADVIKAKGIRVGVYSASSDVQLAVERLAIRTGLQIYTISPSSHEEMLRHHGQARLSIGLSISDGLSTSALESVIMGSFPIQSNTCCLGEIIRNGEGALFVPPEDTNALTDAIVRGLTDDELVDNAAICNLQAAYIYLDESVVRPQVISAYKSILET